MAKTEDPYKGLVDITRRIAMASSLQPLARIGVIVTPPPAITIKVNGYTIDSSYVYIDDYWIPGHTRHMVGETANRAGGSGEAQYESHNHPIDNDESLTDTWKVGDKVLLIPIADDDNRTVVQYVVLCKPKRLDGN